jgi:acetyltransferase-like isoleucine patch superfamily enzyme
MKIVKLMLIIVGVALRYTYRVSGDVIPKWKYVYFFFYQRILMFNVHVPWPCHPTATVNNVKRIKWGLGSMPGTGPGQYIQGGNGIILGDNVWLGPGVKIISANHDLQDYTMHIDSGPVIIGNDVWIGANAVILPQVTIGDNVVIGAGSIVTKNIPSNSIAVGNPCRVISGKQPYAGVR